MKSVKQNKILLKSFQELIHLPLPFTNGGFTLIEILVAVLIVGILGAIMLPQYQRAALKSRYAALMPIAKSMADSNEVYYLDHGEYADNAEDLPVQGRQNYPDGTELEFGTSTDYAYVLASNPSVEHNTYIVYQKHSKNFAGNTHCEALTVDEKANQVCQSFGGTPLDGSLGGEDYTAYLLSGNGNGTFEKECKGSFPTEKACPSGCGVMTRDSAGCNTSTGQWNDEGFDEEDCPKPLGTDTEDCPAGYTGTRTRQGNVCQDGAYTWGSWSNTCQEDPCYGATSCSGGVATACQSGFYLKKNKCYACGTGMATCHYYEYNQYSSWVVADSCIEGYFLETGNTSQDRWCSSCSVWGSATLTCSSYGASSCQPRYYIQNKKCYACGSHELTCDQYGALTCDPGYRVNYPGSYSRSCVPA